MFWGKHAASRLQAHTPALHNTQDFIMDAERINLIGTRLADLRQRTAALRGYL